MTQTSRRLSVRMNRKTVSATAIALAALIVVQLPYASGYVLSGDDMVYEGLIMNVEDSQSYLAKMRLGREGSPVYRIPFTTEEQDGALVGGFYLAWGWLASAMGGPLEFWWHLARIVSAGALLGAIYLFIAHFVDESGPRLFAYLLALFGSGLGWLPYALSRPWLLGAQPTDFKMPEAHPFFTLMAFPHFSAGLAAVLLAIVWADRSLVGERRFAWIGVGVASSLVAIALPYWILLVATGVAAMLLAATRHGAARSGGTARLAFAALPPTAIILYQVYVLWTNPLFRTWFDQAATPSPHPLHYLLAFLPLILLAAPAMAEAWRTQDRHWGLVLWILILVPLLYAPLNPQRRIVAGLHVPLTVLAAQGVFTYWLPRIERSRLVTSLIRRWPQRYERQRLGRLALAGMLALAVPSNAYLVTGYLVKFSEPEFPFFRERGVVAAEAWLDDNATFDDAVLTTYWTGTFLPAQAGVRVYLGHWAETARFDEKLEATTDFFDGDTDDVWRQRLLADHGIDFVFYGPRESALGGLDPDKASYLEPAYRNDLVTIYQVVVV